MRLRDSDCMKLSVKIFVVHWNCNVILMKFSSLAAPKVVILTTFGTASDEISSKWPHFHLNSVVEHESSPDLWHCDHHHKASYDIPYCHMYIYCTPYGLHGQYPDDTVLMWCTCYCKPQFSRCGSLLLVNTDQAQIQHKVHVCRADYRFAPSQWETALLCNDVSHWLGASLESALCMSYLYENFCCMNGISIVTKTAAVHPEKHAHSFTVVQQILPVSFRKQRWRQCLQNCISTSTFANVSHLKADVEANFFV